MLTDPSQNWRNMMACFKGTEPLREVKEMPALPIDSGTRSEFKGTGKGGLRSRTTQPETIGTNQNPKPRQKAKNF